MQQTAGRETCAQVSAVSVPTGGAAGAVAGSAAAGGKAASQSEAGESAADKQHLVLSLCLVARSLLTEKHIAAIFLHTQRV